MCNTVVEVAIFQNCSKTYGLPSVAPQWFRVRAMGTAGPSGWSEPAVKTVPWKGKSEKADG